MQQRHFQVHSTRILHAIANGKAVISFVICATSLRRLHHLLRTLASQIPSILQKSHLHQKLQVTVRAFHSFTELQHTFVPYVTIAHVQFL